MKLRLRLVVSALEILGALRLIFSIPLPVLALAYAVATSDRLTGGQWFVCVLVLIVFFWRGPPELTDSADHRTL